MSLEFKVSELAREFGVHRNTIRNWINSGRLRARPAPGRRYLVDPRDYEQLCHRYGRTPPPASEPAVQPVAEAPRSSLPPLLLGEQTTTLHDDPAWAERCLTCGSCSAACPLAGVDGLDPRRIVRMALLGLEEELLASDWPWKCTLCGRCEEACPMDMEIMRLMHSIRGHRERHQVPGPLHRGVTTCLSRGNNMGIPGEDFVALLQQLGEELAREGCRGFVTPIDRHGARLLITVNSKEVFSEPDNLKYWWRILHAAGESWTISSTCWEGVNWGLFTGDQEAMRTLVGRLVDTMQGLNCQALLLPECGHAYFATRYGLERWYPEVQAEYRLYSVFDLLLEYLHQGRLRLDPERHTRLATCHDPCHYGRISAKYFGRAYFAEAREIIASCCPRFVDLVPGGLDSYCCGAGGTSWTTPFAAERVYAGRLKARQIRESGAGLVVTACHNCRDQIMKSLAREFDLDIRVKYLWQLVAEALV